MKLLEQFSFVSMCIRFSSQSRWIILAHMSQAKPPNRSKRKSS